MAILEKLIAILFFVPLVVAYDPCANLSGQDKVSCYTQRVSETQGQERTLSSQINIINKQISVTEFQVAITQEKLGRLENDISSVSGKIDRIENSLSHVSTVLANRIVATYVAGRTEPTLYLLGSRDFSDFWQRFEYLRIAQKQDKNLMFQMAQTRKNYNDQKDLLTQKKKQVETLSLQLKTYQAQLTRQNREKQALLTITQNDEARYQQLLADAQQEIAGIAASQFTGKKDVKKGEAVGFMGSTGYSTGPHLHFGVYNLEENQAANFNYQSGDNNPLNFLKNRSVSYDSGACYDSPGTLGSGNWDWPMSSPRISQCYGSTPYSWRYANGLHTGVDMWQTGDIAIKAVDDGVAYFYRGNSSLGNNVRVFHGNGKMTLYLHLQ